MILAKHIQELLIHGYKGIHMGEIYENTNDFSKTWRAMAYGYAMLEAAQISIISK